MKKKELRNIHDFSSIKRATRKFHVRLSRAKQCQRNVQKKKCAARAKFFFSLLSPFDSFFFFFLRFSLLSPVGITRFLFFSALLALAKTTSDY